jgi:hypothetical protein
MNMKKLCCLIPLLLGFSVSCEQKPLYDYFNIPPFIYVATSGNDTTGDGSQTAPYATIEYAVSKASGRTNICIAVGNYIINNHLVLKKGISLLGAYDAATWTRQPYQTTADRTANPTNIIVGGGYSYPGLSSDPSRTIDIGGNIIDNETIIEGLTIVGNATSTFPCVLFIHDGASPIIRYNTIDGGINNTSSGICGITILTNANPVIQNNYITSGSNTFALSKVMGIDVSNARASITNNEITTSTTSSNLSYCIVVTSGAVTTISGNTLRLGSNAQLSFAVYSEDASTQTTIVSNNINDAGLSGVQNKAAIYCSSNNPVIRDNTISLSVTTTQSTAIQLDATQNAIIQHNTITETGGGLTDVITLILIQTGSTSVISRNSITINNTATNYAIYDVSGNGNNLICSNYINVTGNADTGIYTSVSSSKIINNTIVSHGYGIFIDGSTAISIINNIISVNGPSRPCVWETATLYDPLYFNNNVLLYTASFIFNDISVPMNINSVAALQTNNLTYTNNISPAITINADGSIPLADQGFINSQGDDISATYPAAMIDIAGIARTVPLTIGAYEY